jgi:hypothetical protein
MPEATTNGSTPMSSRRVSVLGASFVSSVERTRPVAAAVEPVADEREDVGIVVRDQDERSLTDAGRLGNTSRWSAATRAALARAAARGAPP